MKTIKFIAMLFIATLVFVSCQNEDALETEEISAEKYPEIASKLRKMYFNTDDLVSFDFELPDGTKQEMFRVEGDIVLSRKQIMEMEMGGDITAKQYRTNNLVSTSGGTRTITIIGYTGNVYGLSNKEQTGLRWAVNNYNNLNLKIKFQLNFGTNFGSKDMVVYHNPYKSGNGGEAGFPSGGNPFKWVQIYGLSGYSTNVNEHVITHEIGHAVGFRHTDWNTRVSCGQSGEAAGSDGAVHIPGTPGGSDWNSIMMACFSSSEDGEFGYYDRVALNYLY